MRNGVDVAKPLATRTTDVWQCLGRLNQVLSNIQQDTFCLSSKGSTKSRPQRRTGGREGRCVQRRRTPHRSARSVPASSEEWWVHGQGPRSRRICRRLLRSTEGRVEAPDPSRGEATAETWAQNVGWLRTLHKLSALPTSTSKESLSASRDQSRHTQVRVVLLTACAPADGAVAQC